VKRVFVINDDPQGYEGLLRLLRENGYTITPGGGDDQFLLERSDFRAGVPDGTGSGMAIENSREAGSGDAMIREQPIRNGESLRRMLLYSPTAMLVSRAGDGTILDGNHHFVHLSGYDRDELVGQNILNLFFFLDSELWSEAFRMVEGKGEIHDLETRIWTKDNLVAFVVVSLRREEVDGIPCHVMTLREQTPDTVSGQPAPESLLAEDMDFSREEVGRLLDFRAIQDLMNSFYKITRIGIGINDIKGNIQVATGWQDVCTRFHRVNPETFRNCLESDIYLSREVGRGEAIYRCKNGMWDMATPLVIGGRHIANIFLGQFFFEGEVPDYDFFREQAKAHGYDVAEYLAALDRVPRWSRELVQNVMEFYRKLAMMISRLSIGNIQLIQALAEQKRISEELRQAKLVVENSPVVLFRWRAGEGWPVELVSGNVARFGYTREELLSGSVPFSTLVYPDDLQRVAEEVKKYTAAGIDSFQQEYRIVTRDGTLRWVDDRTVTERDGEGRVTHFQGTVMDISERKWIEQQLRFTQFAIDKTIDQAFWMTADSRLFYVNEAACRALGYTRQELEGMSIPDIDPTFPPEVFAEHWRDIRENGSVTFETWHRSKDGRVYPVEIRANYVVFDGKEYNCAFAADISERKRAEETLRESEQKFRVLVETLPAAIMLHQGERFIYANPATSLITGYGEAELLGMNFWEWCREEDWDAIRERGRARLLGETEPPQYEYRMITKSGEEKWVMVSAGITEYRGKPTIIATLLDITETKRVEERMEVALAEKTVLLKEVHHRVKNNLQIISSLLDLQSDSIPDDLSRGYLRENQNRVRSMALVHERLYLSRNLDSIDFGVYIRDLSQYLVDSYGVNAKGVSLMVNGTDVTLGINEAIPCGLILNELVSNALKHAFPAQGPGGISIDYAVENSWISFRVADTGAGLPAGLDFRNTHSLGLQLVTMLVRQLRGRLDVESGEGGTTVSITFPMSAQGG
jgi:PAS domain S-box-containing protein